MKMDQPCSVHTVRVAAKHSNNHAFHHCYESSSRTAACKKMMCVGVNESEAVVTLLSDQASHVDCNRLRVLKRV